MQFSLEQRPSHVAVQAARRGPDCPGHCGIATPGCPPRERKLAGSGSREHGERPDSSGCGERLWHVAVQPLIAARRFPPLRGPSPAPAPPGRRADAPSSHAQSRPPPARSPGPAPLTAAPAPGAPRPVREARKVRRKVRVSGPACSGRRTAPPGTWKAKGGKEAARVLVDIFLNNQRSVLEFCEKTDRHPNTNTGHLPASSANKT